MGTFEDFKVENIGEWTHDRKREWNVYEGSTKISRPDVDAGTAKHLQHISLYLSNLEKYKNMFYVN